MDVDHGSMIRLEPRLMNLSPTPCSALGAGLPTPPRPQEVHPATRLCRFPAEYGQKTSLGSYEAAQLLGLTLQDFRRLVAQRARVSRSHGGDDLSREVIPPAGCCSRCIAMSQPIQGSTGKRIASTD